ncbi:MAG: efflux RND transporter periplasmic adaptor subunit [Planctomycetaceae bacterium]
MSVMRGDLFVGVTSTGTVEPVQIIDVGAQIVGSVKSFGPDSERPGKTIDYRSRVKEGDVLAQLDDLPHRAELDKAGANLQLAEAELNQSRARNKQMERAFHRATELRDVDPEAEYEKAEAANDMAKAEVAMAEAKVEQAKIAKKQADIHLGYTVIRSPVDGVVIDRRVNVGQTVVAGMNAPSLFLLAKDLSQMLVWAAVNEADIASIHVGQAVTFTVDAYDGRTFSGKASQIRLNASLQQNVVTYGVIVEVDNAGGELLPYMTAKLQFELARRQNAVLVPNQALRWQPALAQILPTARKELKTPQTTETRQAKHDDGSTKDAEPKVDLGSPTVWKVAEDGLVRPVPVKVGLSDGVVTEILGGELEVGDAVVTNILRKAEPDFVSSFVDPVTESEE